MRIITNFPSKEVVYISKQILCELKENWCILVKVCF